MTPAKIIDNIEQLFGVPRGSIIGRRKTAYLVKARAAACMELKKLGLSTTEIGEVLGRDHSTIMNLLKKDDRTQ